ncbi:dCMP deaminase [Salsuginibacillus halophilus]|uniref:ComE operon protein 2 n=1 Tax=Salsuginibacillus halophilus TaxID=517424 RepID=A0A2P8HFQ0_9BACI|nr:ComE operon protein 2 [Salsuginibacillus halophilus]PSL45046.1 dCMP deaminase [Salsuginibacillus halophilus]
MERLSWHQYFMAQSHLLAKRSTCPRLAVGATIVREKRIIAGGYNGSISGGDHCLEEGCYVVDGHCIRTIHAEMNALLQCAKFGVNAEGAEIYVTHYPCVHCAKAIIQAGIQRIIYAVDYKNHPYAAELFEQAGVVVEQVELEEGLFEENREEKMALAADVLKRLESAGVEGEEIREWYERINQLFYK